MSVKPNNIKTPSVRKKIPVAFSPKDEKQQIGGKPFDVWADKQDIMQEFHLSERTLHNLRKKKNIPYSRLGNKIFYNRTKLEEMLLNTCSKTQLGLMVLSVFVWKVIAMISLMAFVWTMIAYDLFDFYD